MNTTEIENEREIGYKTGEADVAKWIETFGLYKAVELADDKIVQLFDDLLILEVTHTKVPPYVQGLAKCYEDFLMRHFKKGSLGS